MPAKKTIDARPRWDAYLASADDLLKALAAFADSFGTAAGKLDKEYEKVMTLVDVQRRRREDALESDDDTETYHAFEARTARDPEIIALDFIQNASPPDFDEAAGAIKGLVSELRAAIAEAKRETR